MGHVERSLAKLRRQARASNIEASGSESDTPSAKLDAKRLPSSGADLLERARDVVLDPDTLQGNRIIGLEDVDAGVAGYKMLRTRILHRMRTNGWRKLAVTSPRAAAGKTVTSINLAISLAQEPNQDVILVDLDLRNSRVYEYLGLDLEFGLVDHLTQQVPLEHVVLKPDIPRLYLVPNATSLRNSSELLASPEIAAFTQMLLRASPSTIIIFDLPPLLEADDMLTFMPQVDAVLLVVSERETRRADLERANELFKELNVIGTLLNKSNDKAPAYY